MSVSEHDLEFERSIGFVRARCSCGWAGSWLTDKDDATEEWDFHCDDVFEEATRP